MKTIKSQIPNYKSQTNYNTKIPMTKTSMQIVREADIQTRLKWAKNYLKSCAVPNPDIDAELILSYSLDKDIASEFERLVHLRGTRYPLQYIIGFAHFMGLEFKVEPGVFIPRPETELLVEKTLNTQYAIRDTQYEPCILDLCTGCGNIAISLTKFLKIAKIVASDVSTKAIEAAEENIRSHNCSNIKLVRSNLFDNIYVREFDIIVSNPPYVSESDFRNLMSEVLCEPRISLFGGEDGLQFYKGIFKEAHFFLKEGGYLIVEIGYNQVDFLKEILDAEKYFLQEIVKDYNGIDRVMIIKRL